MKQRPESCGEGAYVFRMMGRALDKTLSLTTPCTAPFSLWICHKVINSSPGQLLVPLGSAIVVGALDDHQVCREVDSHGKGRRRNQYGETGSGGLN